jgi:hypothetical protein
MAAKANIILTAIILSITIAFSLNPPFAYGQGIAGIVERLGKLERQLAAIEAAQKKDRAAQGSEPLQSASIAEASELRASDDSLMARIDRITEAIEHLKVSDARTAEELDKGEKLSSGLHEAVTLIQNQILAGKAKEKGPLPVQAKFPVSLYGLIKMDAAYDASRINSGNYARWVECEGKGDDQFSMTARQSRFGMSFGPLDEGNMKTSGKVEIDFYGSSEENKNAIMMRHAYIEVNWPKREFTVLAGQTSDVISPLSPNTLNYVVGWWAGNIGYRRPQLRLTKGHGLSKNSRTTLELAAMRSIGGESAGYPCLQGRLALSLPGPAQKKSS